MNRSTGAGCIFINGSAVPGFVNATLQFDAAQDFYPDAAMRWTLRVTKALMYDITFAEITISPLQVLSVGIRTVKEGFKVNRNTPVILDAAVYSYTPYNLTYLWSSVPALPPEAFSTGTFQKYLKILPGFLSEGYRYTFVCDVSGSSTSGEAAIRLTVNRAPRFGTFRVTPTAGISRETVFSLGAADWVDDNLPLDYRFSYLDPSTGEYAPLSLRSVTTSLSTLLNGEGNLTLRLDVTDALNATASVYQIVSLAKSDSVSASDLITGAAGNIATDPVSSLRLLLYAATSLNCSAEISVCKTAVDILLLVEASLFGHTTETDEITLAILAGMNMSTAAEDSVIEILSRVAARETEVVDRVLSVDDDQVESKSVLCGISMENAKMMVLALGSALSGMSSVQIPSRQSEILAVLDSAGRSLIKDDVPAEGQIMVQAGSISMSAQKVAPCSPREETRLVSGSLSGVDYVLPICGILPVNQTLFPEKTLNRQSPYDLIVQVIDRNVMGDCVPLSSKLLRVVVYDDSHKSLYSATNVSSPSPNFTFRLAPDFPESSLPEIACVFFSASEGTFTPATLITSLANISRREFVCSTTHLSEFALQYILPSTRKAYCSSEFWLLLAILIVCISTHGWATYMDNRTKTDIVKVLQERSGEVLRKLASRQRAGKNDSAALVHDLSVASYMPVEIKAALERSEGQNDSTALGDSEPGKNHVLSITPRMTTAKILALIVLVLFSGLSPE